MNFPKSKNRQSREENLLRQYRAHDEDPSTETVAVIRDRFEQWAEGERSRIY